MLGPVNIAYLFALSQFFMAWGIAWPYVSAARKFDEFGARIMDPQREGTTKSKMEREASNSCTSINSCDVPLLYRHHPGYHGVGFAPIGVVSRYFAANRRSPPGRTASPSAGDYMSPRLFSASPA